MKPTAHPKTSLALLVLAVLSILPSAGCGNSGGVMAPAIMFNYAPASGPSPSVTTVLGPASTSSVAEIEIYISGVPDVLAASFTLDYDQATVVFLDFDVAASHLVSDGAAIQPIVQQTQTGQVTVGVTRLGATGIDFDQTHLLIRIRFLRAASSGTSALTFGNNELLNSMAPPQPISGVQWFGGNFQIN